MLVRALVVLIIEEDPTEPARLAAMLDQKVVVGPLLELGVVLGVVLVADVLVGPVEMRHIFFKKIRRRDVRASPEPPDAAVGLKVPIVEVHRRRHRVPRVHDARQSTSKEGDPLPGLHALGPDLLLAP